MGGSGVSGTVKGVAALSVAPSWFCEPLPSAQLTVQLTSMFSLALPESTATDIEPGEGTVRVQIADIAVIPVPAAGSGQGVGVGHLQARADRPGREQAGRCRIDDKATYSLHHQLPL